MRNPKLCNIVLDLKKNQGLDIHNLRGQCYDGARNVSGRVTGLQTRIRSVEPRAHYSCTVVHIISVYVYKIL